MPTWVFFTEHAHDFLTTGYPFSDVQQDKTPCHKVKAVFNWFLDLWVRFTRPPSKILKSLSSRARLGRDGKRDLHHGCADEKSAACAWWTKISKTYFHHLLRYMPWRIKMALDTLFQTNTSKVYQIKWLVSKSIMVWIAADKRVKLYYKVGRDGNIMFHSL